MLQEELLVESIDSKISKIKGKWFFYSRISLLAIIYILLEEYRDDNMIIDFYSTSILYLLLVSSFQLCLNVINLMRIGFLLNTLSFISLVVFPQKRFVYDYSMVYHVISMVFEIFFYLKMSKLYSQRDSILEDEHDENSENYV